eukprot:CAMPEP_0119361464 /NCGR_PEP_ID=MMETSP1334-20130426/8759_1 /TAXON_ID=127549 /ORGANISM="Calcidiscus leptoporus, Strain RCC1130" /LENGTH=91 /DNA_ID=CAMNT_0007376479 /DNA_START=35 /DNA_END=306 /DNA_ORIENTATION=+
MVKASDRAHWISGLLRVAFTDAGAAWELRAQQAEQQQCLKRRQARDESSAACAGPQSWAELTRGIPESTSGYAVHAAHYRRFLGAVSEVLG